MGPIGGDIHLEEPRYVDAFVGQKYPYQFWSIFFYTLFLMDMFLLDHDYIFFLQFTLFFN